MRRRLRDGRDGRALVEELERVGDALPAGPEKSHWFLELAVVCEMLVPERLRALQLYSRAVDLDPGTTEAIDRGRMVCRELGRVDELIRLTEIELSHETDESRRERLATLIGDALLDLGDRQRAAGFLVRAAGQFPSSLAIQDALGTVGYDDDWRSEVDRLIAIGEDAADAEAGARVSLRAARVLHMEAPEDERYEQLLQRALYYDAYDESAFQLLDTHYASAGRWDELDQLQDQLVHAFPGVDEQAALCQRFSFGWIARGQHDRAAAWCWRAIELGRLVYPIAGLTMLRGLYASRRDWDRLLAACDALLATPLDEDADVHTSLLGGTIAWKAKADLPRAAGYFERVRRIALDSQLVIDFDDAVADQRNPEVIGDEQRALMDAARRVGKTESIERSIEAWKKASAADPTKRAPRRALARVLSRGERWRTLADALKDEEARACRDDGERVAVLFQLVALYRDRLRQDLLLTATLQRILELQPGNLAALDQLEAAFAGMRRWPDVVATLARKLGHVPAASERVELQIKLADIWHDKLSNEAEAVKALAGALALDPTRDGVAERLERAYVKRREWDKLVLLKQERLVLLTDPAARLAAYLELATLATEKLKKPALAIEAWTAVLALDGDHEAALAALERLYLAGEAHALLADIYARRAAQDVAATTQLNYLQKLAQLCTTELADAPRAVATWQKVLALQPTHLRAREMLKRLYVGQRAWDELQALFADERQLDECARLYERQAADESPEVQLELWLRAGRLWREPLERRDAAMRAYERALALVPHHAGAILALVALYEEADEHKKLAGVLALQLEEPADAATEKSRRLRLAALHARELRDGAGAFRWQLGAFILDPFDPALRGELEHLAARTGSWAELVAQYEKVAAERSDVDRVALLSTVARQKEAALGDVDGALVTWRQLAAVNPPPPEALAALVRIYDSRSAWRELHDVYLRKLELCHGIDERRPIVLAMAGLAERQGDDARAIVAYRRLADELGADDATLDALERLHERAGALDEVEAVLLERLLLPGAASRRTPLIFRLAEVRRRLGRLPDAIALYGEVLDAEPNHAGARAGLEAIADGGGEHRLAAALLLEPILRATGDAVRLAQVFAIRIEHASDPGEAVALLHELAWLEERELGRSDDAFATLARALRTDPSHQPTFDALETLTGVGGDWERLATLYKEIAGRPLSIAEHVEVRCRLGALYRDRQHDVERALRTFTRVLDLSPDNAVVERAIDELLASAGRHAELAERLGAQLLRRPDGAEAQAIALRLAGLYERELGNAAAAIDAYAAILAGDSDNSDALAGLERLFGAGVERQKVAALLMPRYRDSGRAADLARIWMASLIQSPETQPLEELTALARSAGQLGALADALAVAVERTKAPTTRASLRLALAGLERERGAAAKAEALLAQVLAEAPEHQEALRALDALLAAEARHADRVAVLGRRAALAEPETRRELYLTRAELQANALGDLDGARATLVSALALGDELRVLRALARLADDETAMTLWPRVRAEVPDDDEALTALAALYEHHDRWRELAEVLERQLAAASGEAAAALVEQQALIWTRLGDRAAAEAAWRRLTMMEPRAPRTIDAWRALARLYTAAERWSELAAVLEALVELAATPDEVAAAATQLARLEAETLERPERAIAAWQRVLAAGRRSDEALAALATLYARTGHGGERRLAIERRAELAASEGRADAAQLAGEAADVAVADGDSAGAVAWYERVVALEPQQPVAQAYLESSYRERGDWRALVTLLRARALRLGAGDERGEVLAQVAAVEERELGDLGAAFGALLDAFESDGRWPAHGDDLKRLAAAQNGWSILAATLQRRAAAGSPAERHELYLELGGVLETARQLPAALEAYRALLALDAGYVPALERLERIYRQSGQPALLEVLARRAELAPDRDEQLRLYQDLAGEAARLERWARAVDAHRRSAELEPHGDGRGQQLYRAGVICRDHLAAFDEALDCFQAAVDSYSADGAAPPAMLAEAIERLRAGTRAAGRT